MALGPKLLLGGYFAGSRLAMAMALGCTGPAVFVFAGALGVAGFLVAPSFEDVNDDFCDALRDATSGFFDI